MNMMMKLGRLPERAGERSPAGWRSMLRRLMEDGNGD